MTQAHDSSIILHKSRFRLRKNQQFISLHYSTMDASDQSTKYVAYVSAGRQKNKSRGKKPGTMWRQQLPPFEKNYVLKGSLH